MPLTEAGVNPGHRTRNAIPLQNATVSKFHIGHCDPILTADDGNNWPLVSIEDGGLLTVVIALGHQGYREEGGICLKWVQQARS